MTELTIPYYDTELYSKVLIEPLQLNNNLYVELKNNLKFKVENKCNKYGFITKIYKILDFSDGRIITESFNASIVFNIKYSCRLCKPTNETNIICSIELLNKSLIKAVNGPIICIISLSRINTNNFEINNNGDIFYKKTNSQIKINDKVIVNIKGVNFYSNDVRIVTLGYLLDIPSTEDVKKYYDDSLDIKDIDEGINENKKFLSQNNTDI